MQDHLRPESLKGPCLQENDRLELPACEQSEMLKIVIEIIITIVASLYHSFREKR